MTTVKKQLNSANKLYLNSKDLHIPTISMTSKYLELKPVEQLKFQNVSHGDLIFRKSIIKLPIKKIWDKKNLWKKQIPQLHTFKLAGYCQQSNFKNRHC